MPAVSITSPVTVKVPKRRVNNNHKARDWKVNLGRCKQKKKHHLNRRQQLENEIGECYQCFSEKNYLVYILHHRHD